jgi:hypothetical protein
LTLRRRYLGRENLFADVTPGATEPVIGLKNHVGMSWLLYGAGTQTMILNIIVYELQKGRR